MAEIRIEILNIYGAPLDGENPLPVFRNRNHDMEINCIEPFPEDKKSKFGTDTGYRVLPYRVQDRFTRKRIPMQFKMIVLENSVLKAAFLPEMGGRLISLIDKRLGKELLSRNPIFQPGNLAIRNAWFSGGIEWNIGQIGHTFHTCSPLFAAIVRGKDGEQFLRIYDFERCKRLFWQIDFYLPEDSPVLYAYTRIINPNKEDTPMYWWTNIAVPETPGVRIFSSAEDVIYNDHGIISGAKGFGYAKMPVLPTLPGKDFSYPYNSDFSNEYFFQSYPQKMLWEAAAYEDNKLFFEASTERLRYRKMFCWGNHNGGRHWQEFLSEPGNAYLEIQAGLAPTQLHGIDMPAEAVWDWTQVFGGTNIETQDVHDKDWFKAKVHVENEIHRIISELDIYKKEAYFKANADIVPEEILHTGLGWGALENQRMLMGNEVRVPSGCTFPISTMGEEQYPWLYLLQTGKMYERSVSQLPGAWMVQKEWKQLLFSSIENEDGCNWYALLHAGVMAFEDGQSDTAENLWKQSIEKKESVWAYRNLAVARNMDGDLQSAINYMSKAMEMPEALSDSAIVKEYLELLTAANRYSEAWDVYIQLPVSIQNAERVRLIAGTIAIELDNNDFEAKLFEYDYACIREGETILTDLWFRYTANMLAKEKGIIADSELLGYVKQNYEPPVNVDSRVHKVKKHL